MKKLFATVAISVGLTSVGSNVAFGAQTDSKTKDCSTIAAMTNSSITSTYFVVVPNTLSKSELKCFSATQVNDFLLYLTESQIAALDVSQLTAITFRTIVNLLGTKIQSFTTKQLKAMTDIQLQAILDYGKASDSQKVTINYELTGTKTSPTTTIKTSPTTTTKAPKVTTTTDAPKTTTTKAPKTTTTKAPKTTTAKP